jgi:hypothetical protein
MRPVLVAMMFVVLAACTGTPTDGGAAAVLSTSSATCVPQSQTGSRIKRCTTAADNGADELATRARSVGGEGPGKTLPR